MASFVCRATARVRVRIVSDVVPSAHDAEALLRDMVRSGAEEYFGLLEDADVTIEAVDPAPPPPV